jgi:hypothetical protein
VEAATRPADRPFRRSIRQRKGRRTTASTHRT